MVPRFLQVPVVAYGSLSKLGGTGTGMIEKRPRNRLLSVRFPGWTLGSYGAFAIFFAATESVPLWGLVRCQSSTSTSPSPRHSKRL